MKNKKIILFLILALLIIVMIFMFKRFKSNDNNTNQVSENIAMPSVSDVEIDKNQVEYNNTATIDELKESTGVQGSSDIYDVKEEYDGRKTLAVKSSIQYKVALCGYLDNKDLELSQIDKIISEKAPKNSGIWVEESSREGIQEFLNQVSKTEYVIKDGYLSIKKSDNENGLDKALKKYIDSDKLVVLAKTGNIKMVDYVTGKIEDYPFEKMDEYQSYDYVSDNGNYVISLAKNEKNKIKNEEFVDVLKSILK